MQINVAAVDEFRPYRHFLITVDQYTPAEANLIRAWSTQEKPLSMITTPPEWWIDSVSIKRRRENFHVMHKDYIKQGFDWSTTWRIWLVHNMKDLTIIRSVMLHSQIYLPTIGNKLLLLSNDKEVVHQHIILCCIWAPWWNCSPCFKELLIGWDFGSGAMA